MDVRTLYDKEFLYAYDLQGHDATVTITKVVGGTLIGTGGKKNKKPVIYFQGKEKGLALNITNARTIAQLYGSFDSTAWIGKRITLYPTTTTFGSQSNVECIRIRPVKPGTKVKDAPPDEPTGHEEREPGADDDEGAAA
jgi:hypothetical protein